MTLKSESRLRELKNWWVCTETEGLISRKGYNETITEPLDHVVKTYEKFNLLFSYKNYQGWEPEAAQLSLESILKQAPYARRVAYVNPPASKVFQMKLFKKLMPNGTVRFFNEMNYDEALHWVREEID